MTAATDSQVQKVIAIYEKNRASNFANTRGWLGGSSDTSDPKTVLQRIVANIQVLGRQSGGPVPRVPKLTPELEQKILQLGNPALATDDGLAAFVTSAPALLVVVPLLRAHFGLQRGRQELGLMIEKALPQLEKNLAVANADALMSAFGLSITPAQSKMLDRVVESQRARLTSSVRELLELLKGDRPLDFIGLVDALLRDLIDLSQKHSKAKAEVAAAS